MGGPYFVVGSWDDWADFHEMTTGEAEEEPKFCARLQVRRSPGHEEFQIVCKKDWTRRFHPAGGGRVYGPDNMHGVNWQVQVPAGCDALKVIWDPRGARSCEWRFHMQDGSEQAPASKPSPAPVADTPPGPEKMQSRGQDVTMGRKFGPQVQKLLRPKADSGDPETPLETDTSPKARGVAQKLLGAQKDSAGRGNARQEFELETTGRTLQSSLVESEELSLIKEELALQRRAALMTSPIRSSQWSEPDQAHRKSQPMAAMKKEPQQMEQRYPQAPNQELRRQQLKASGKQDSLNSVLKAVRRDWSENDRAAVIKKLGNINITSIEDLAAKLRDHGVNGINTLLRGAGGKGMKEETLKRLQEHLQVECVCG